MRITKALRTAIQTYYFNRSRQGVRKWDKEADLDLIEAQSGKFHFQAMVGTFWFIYRTTKHRVTYSTNEKIFPKFEKISEPLDQIVKR